MDLWSELEIAALLAKHVADDAGALPAAAALELATLNGARALGLDQVIGSLVPGKAADVICVELEEPALAPMLDPISQLAYAASRNHVSDVWVAGEHLVAQRELVRMDVPAILGTAKEWGRKLARG
jgi:5-methylthioadenosine/S-adenosylhomocysteine deaminase